jgi:hypothetical protein
MTFAYASDQFPYGWSSETSASYRGSVDVSTSKHNLSGGGSLIVFNDGPIDQLVFPYLPLSGLHIFPFTQPEIYVAFADHSSQLFKDTKLPWPLPLLSDWTYIDSFISFPDGTIPGGSSRRVYFSIDEMTAVAAPTQPPTPTPTPTPGDQEPPTLALAAPVESVTSTRWTSFTVRGTASDNVRPTRLEYRVQPPRGNYTKWVRGTLTGTGKSRSWSQAVDLPTEGAWRVRVRVADAAGNWSESVARTIVVDRMRPTVVVTSPTTASTPLRTARFTLRGTVTDDRAPDALEYRVQRPGGSYTKWQRGTLTGAKKTRSWSQAVDLPTEGAWRVRVRGVDAAGNRSAAVTRTAVVDRTAPTVVVSTPRSDKVATSLARYTLEGTVSDNVTAVRMEFRVRPPAGSYGKWEVSNLSGSSAEKSWARQVRVNALGEWRVQIRAADRAGNVSAARTITINRL